MIHIIAQISHLSFTNVSSLSNLLLLLPASEERVDSSELTPSLIEEVQKGLGLDIW